MSQDGAGTRLFPAGERASKQRRGFLGTCWGENHKVTSAIENPVLIPRHPLVQLS